ncbi:DUF5320 domain-containing protein [Patescibacteria group bacterium]|nr:DUF5320 domain-containing protein [Patescibacteria group bacterium]
MRKGGDSMPNRDGTGPNGQGSMTGRGMGNCANSALPEGQIAPNNRRGAGLNRRQRKPRLGR